jgi:anti-sigma factor ChrR (cupin superfamily)
MRHTEVEDELLGQAALYALGALEGTEARDFEEHIAGGCAACAAELKEFDAVAAALALAAPAFEPPEAVRGRLLARVAEETQEPPASGEHPAACVDAAARPEPEAVAAPGVVAGAAGFLVVRANEGEWVESEDRGVFFKPLFADRQHGTFTSLVRLSPGARIPSHRHLGVEQCLVLEGDVRSGGYVMGAGDFNCSLPGSVHDELVTDQGALLLIVAPASYEVVGTHSDSVS